MLSVSVKVSLGSSDYLDPCQTMYLLLPNNTGWRGNGHVGDEHVDIVRLEVPQGSQGRSSWFSAVHQVRHGQAVQAGLLIFLRLPARRIPSRGSSKAHSSVNSALVPARLVQTSQVSFQRLQCQTCVANIYSGSGAVLGLWCQRLGRILCQLVEKARHGVTFFLIQCD